MAPSRSHHHQRGESGGAPSRSANGAGAADDSAQYHDHDHEQHILNPAISTYGHDEQQQQRYGSSSYEVHARRAGSASRSRSRHHHREHYDHSDHPHHQHHRRRRHESRGDRYVEESSPELDQSRSRSRSRAVSAFPREAAEAEAEGEETETEEDAPISTNEVPLHHASVPVPVAAGTGTATTTATNGEQEEEEGGADDQYDGDTNVNNYIENNNGNISFYGNPNGYDPEPYRNNDYAAYDYDDHVQEAKAHEKKAEVSAIIEHALLRERRILRRGQHTQEARGEYLRSVIATKESELAQVMVQRDVALRTVDKVRKQNGTFLPLVKKQLKSLAALKVQRRQLLDLRERQEQGRARTLESARRLFGLQGGQGQGVEVLCARAKRGFEVRLEKERKGWGKEREMYERKCKHMEEEVRKLSLLLKQREDDSSEGKKESEAPAALVQAQTTDMDVVCVDIEKREGSNEKVLTVDVKKDTAGSRAPTPSGDDQHNRTEAPASSIKADADKKEGEEKGKKEEAVDISSSSGDNRNGNERDGAEKQEEKEKTLVVPGAGEERGDPSSEKMTITETDRPSSPPTQSPAGDNATDQTTTGAAKEPDSICGGSGGGETEKTTEGLDSSQGSAATTTTRIGAEVKGEERNGGKDKQLVVVDVGVASSHAPRSGVSEEKGPGGKVGRVEQEKGQGRQMVCEMVEDLTQRAMMMMTQPRQSSSSSPPVSDPTPRSTPVSRKRVREEEAHVTVTKANDATANVEEAEEEGGGRGNNNNTKRAREE